MHLPPFHRREFALALAAAVFTAFLHTTAFPFAFSHGRIISVPESGYMFLAPIALWLMTRRSLRATVVTSFAAFFVSWTVLLFWLRHVTLGGTFLVAAIVALFPVLWALAARRILPGLPKRRVSERMALLASLAAVWVVLEWARSWVFGGFPWLPLAASQWDKPVMLQILPFTGYLGLSWMIAFFNLALASYLASLTRRPKGAVWWKSLNAEIVAALLMLVLTVLSVFSSMRAREPVEELFQAGIVQPYVPGVLKWDETLATENVERLGTYSRAVAAAGADIVFWPESSTPWPVLAPDGAMKDWCESLSRETDLPFVMGNMAEIPQENARSLYYNGVFTLRPDTGLSGTFYAKRKLVPFGEYNPLAFATDPFFHMPFESLTPGTEALSHPLTLPCRGRVLRIGPLVCYEDIFPSLARREALEGVDFFFVATNNAWYGEEAGAYQHAAHSVLRAVENRRPVLRCGNGGWSGFIDEYGIPRSVCTRPHTGVYFKGGDVIGVTRHPAKAAGTTFYTRHGDWIVWPALALALAGFFVARRPAPEDPVPGVDKEPEPPEPSGAEQPVDTPAEPTPSAPPEGETRRTSSIFRIPDEKRRRW